MKKISAKQISLAAATIAFGILASVNRLPGSGAFIGIESAQGIDNGRRPFVVIDPRAGHGPDIGGFKADSEIGVAMIAGHPCYFIGFPPEPMAGQTIEDVAKAEGISIEKVIALHPNADARRRRAQTAAA